MVCMASPRDAEGKKRYEKDVRANSPPLLLIVCCNFYSAPGVDPPLEHLHIIHVLPDRLQEHSRGRCRMLQDAEGHESEFALISECTDQVTRTYRKIA